MVVKAITDDTPPIDARPNTSTIKDVPFGAPNGERVIFSPKAFRVEFANGTQAVSTELDGGHFVRYLEEDGGYRVLPLEVEE